MLQLTAGVTLLCPASLSLLFGGRLLWLVGSTKQFVELSLSSFYGPPPPVPIQRSRALRAQHGG